MTSKNEYDLVKQRVVRVFVSSTFRDMYQERERLVKYIFPELRKICEKRNVTWGEVDLRWGITEEQKAEGKVLPICLEEIHRCRPYFICLLGERYGWIPEEIPKDLMQKEPWLKDHLEHSVTELEIIHGVLRNPDMAQNTFFYFRDPKYIDTLQPVQQKHYREHPYSKEINKYGEKAAKQRAEERKNKLKALKKKIINKDLTVRMDYKDPVELGNLVKNDLIGVINNFFPEDEILDPLDKERLEHETFAESRRKIYIGRAKYFKRLDDFVKGDGAPLVILGESGCGKTALLANWEIKFRKENPEIFIIKHFVGASPQSTDWISMIRRILGEFKRKFNIKQDIPDNPEELKMAFTNWLHIIAAREKIVIILDALNQLEDKDQALDFFWLPPVVPANIRLILSTPPGLSLDNLGDRNWPTFEVEPLDQKERGQLISEYLAQYRKTLSPDLVKKIVASEQTKNPLYLRALLEELRIFGVHEQLVERISYYLSAKTIPDLYEKILKRYEEDYEKERSNLIQDSMSLIWAARYGLSEIELLEMLGDNGEPLPCVYWSPIFLAAEQSLVTRSKLICFSHDYFRQAVQSRYLPKNEDIKAEHLKLASYFHKRDINYRKIDELPWQLSEAQEWEGLFDTFSDLNFFSKCFNNNEYETKRYWTYIENNSKHRKKDAYKSILDNPKKYHDFIIEVFILFYHTGLINEALSLSKYIIAATKKEGGKKYYAPTLGLLAVILDHLGKPKEAMNILKKQEKIFIDQGDEGLISESLGNQAAILLNWGKLKEAMKLLKEMEKICFRLGDENGKSVSLGNQALILFNWGKLNEAMKLLKEQDKICRVLGDKRNILISQGHQAVILRDLGKPKEAMKLLKEQEKGYREQGDKDGIQISIGSQAVILRDWMELKEAMNLFKEQERICREINKKDGIASALGRQSAILIDWGKLNEAMKLLKEQERICIELGKKDELQISFGSQALIHKARGKFKEALILIEKQERICRELGNKYSLQITISNKASIYMNSGNLKKAMKFFKEQERICIEIGNKDGLQISFGHQAVMLCQLGEPEKAMKLFKEKERLCKEIGNKYGLSLSLGNQAVILRDLGKSKEAMNLHKEEEKIYREMENNGDLQRSLGNQALILNDWGKPKEALNLLKQQEKICRDLGNKDGLQISFGQQATILRKYGKPKESMNLFKEQERICRELGNKYYLIVTFMNQALCLAEDFGKPNEAWILAEEAHKLATRYGYIQLEKKAKPVLDFIRSKLN